MSSPSHPDGALSAEPTVRLPGSHSTGAAGEVRALACREVALALAGEVRLAVSRSTSGGL